MKVKLKRIEKGIQQQAFAKVLGISRAKLIKIEKGDFSTLQYPLMKKIAKALNSSVQELFFSDEE